MFTLTEKEPRMFTLTEASQRLLRAFRPFALLISALVLLSVTARSTARSDASELEKWLQSERAVATTKLTAAVLPNGAVIASPSKANPDYYYHWVRDGALVMDTIVTLYVQSTAPAERERYWALLAAYTAFSLRNQATPNRSTALGRGLGEPKFNTDGSAFVGDWVGRRMTAPPCAP
jgi:glucoamylase